MIVTAEIPYPLPKHAPLGEHITIRQAGVVASGLVVGVARRGRWVLLDLETEAPPA